MAEENTTQQEQNPGQQQPPKTFTQAELDNIIKDRLAREKEKYAGFDDYKKAAEEWKKIQDSQRSDAEKQTAIIEEWKKKAEEAEQKRIEAEKIVAAERRMRKVMALASAAGAIDPQDANVLAVTKDIDADAADAEQKIKDAIEAVKKQKPYLFKQGGQGLERFNPGTGDGARNETDAQRRARLYGGGGHIFSVDTGKSRGGGVIMPQSGDTPITK